MPLSRTTTKKNNKESSTLSPRAVHPGRAMTLFSPAGWARRERRGPRSRGKRPLLLVLGGKRARVGGLCFWCVRERGAEKKKKRKSPWVDFLSPLPLSSPLFLPKQSNRPLFGFFLPPRNHERPRSARFPPRRRSCVGEFWNLGCERGVRRLDGASGSATLSSSESPPPSVAHDRSLPHAPRNVNSISTFFFTLQ